MDAAADSDEQHVRSVDHLGVFRTQQEALLPGWHEWETNYTMARVGATYHLRGEDWRATGLSCETTLL